ncbi:hypothetical protein ANRL1_01328 [Anaerolineae bacterium]|nr:hypothetical protein ANRL1_01328 [Anaerolineae bacterium]
MQPLLDTELTINVPMIKAPTICGVTIYHVEFNCYVVVITELDDNPGKSVTNASEYIATELKKSAKLSDADVTWVEHYIYQGQHEYDKVEYTWNGNKATNPKWSPLGEDAFKKLIEEEK